MTIATFMILDQLQIAHNIVVITYTALIGAIALASALAFGLGGRSVAERMLEAHTRPFKTTKAMESRPWTRVSPAAKDQAAQLKDRLDDDTSTRN